MSTCLCVDELEKLEEEKKRVVLLISGGLDSIVCLYKLVKEGVDVVPLYIIWQYEKSITCREIEYVEYHLKKLGIKKLRIEVVYLGRMQDDRTAEGSYVPFRNGIFISIAANVAERLGIPLIAIGAHKTLEYIQPHFHTYTLMPIILENPYRHLLSLLVVHPHHTLGL